MGQYSQLLEAQFFANEEVQNHLEYFTAFEGFFTGTLLSVCVHKHTHMLQQILGEMLLS